MPLQADGAWLVLITVGNERTDPDCETLDIFRSCTQLSKVELQHLHRELNVVHMAPSDIFNISMDTVFAQRVRRCWLESFDS